MTLVLLLLPLLFLVVCLMCASGSACGRMAERERERGYGCILPTSAAAAVDVVVVSGILNYRAGERASEKDPPVHHH